MQRLTMFPDERMLATAVMYARRWLLSLVLLPGGAWAQPPVLEVDGVAGECDPVLAASGPILRLYAQPDLQAARIVLPYRTGWRVIAPRGEGRTRVIRAGVLRVISPAIESHCERLPDNGPIRPVDGEQVQYLYDVGEGHGRIRFRGADCVAPVHPDLGYFEMVKPPQVNIWLPVRQADGTTAGWLLHDGSQTTVVAVQC